MIRQIAMQGLVRIVAKCGVGGPEGSIQRNSAQRLHLAALWSMAIAPSAMYAISFTAMIARFGLLG
jgi:hypothetical protein